MAPMGEETKRVLAVPTGLLSGTGRLAANKFVEARMTVTVKLHALEFPAASVATQFTALTPSGKSDPDGGVQITMGVPALSDADTV